MATTREVPLAVAGAVGASEGPYGKLSPGPGKPASEVGAHQRARIHSAMVELVAERGYGAVTVRELARLAGVSTRAFYEHFDGKEKCFLRTYELVVRRVALRVVASQAGERDWRERLRLAFNAFVRELEREPQAARLALVEAYATGPAALEQIRRSQRMFEAMIAESFTRAPDGIIVPLPVIEGMVAGVARVVRARTLVGHEEEPDLGDRLLEWALCYRSESVADLGELDRRSVRGGSADEPSLVPSSTKEDGPRSPTGDRSLILSAVAKLSVAEGYGHLTVPRIRAAAGVPQRSFDAHFEGVEDCFLAALDLKVVEAFAHAAHVRATGRTWAGGIYQAIFALCDQVACDHVLAEVCFADIFAPGLQMVRCREDLIASMEDLLASGRPPVQLVDELALEASVGAIWSILRHHVANGRASQVPRLAATLSFLALAPAIGPEAAVDAIGREQQA